MPHLALNTLLPPLMKVRYQVAIGAAPIGLMFASFGLVFWLASWLETTLGIPPNSPINAHPNGTLWIIAFVTCTVALMLLGYALGWPVNQAFCRVALGWPVAKVKAVFLHSEVPSHWLKAGTHEVPDLGAQLIAKWEQQRAQGATRYVLKKGVLDWGAPMFVFMYVVPAFTGKQPIEFVALVVNVGIWLIASAGFGLILWLSSESNYRELKKGVRV
jgi:hypothetical protein